MSGQIRFFYKNIADYSNSAVVATASEGSAYAPRTLNRSNLSSWVTTGSVDANNTTFTVDFIEGRIIDTLILVLHNFKNFLAEYWDGSSWNGFPTAIHPTACTDTTSFFQFAATSMQKIRITIYGTQVPDSDKQLYQFIATQQIGQFTTWPVISNLNHDQNKQISKMLSGRTNINKNLGGVSFDMSVMVWRDAGDLALVQALFDSTEGFLVWVNSNAPSQFSISMKGYRQQDIYLMQCQNNLAPSFYQGVYALGFDKLKITLVEVNQ